jgi:hypothetical protein
MAALAFTLFESFNRASGIDTEIAFARLLFSHILPFITASTDLSSRPFFFGGLVSFIYV